MSIETTLEGMIFQDPMKEKLIRILAKKNDWITQGLLIIENSEFMIDDRVDHDSNSRLKLTKLIREINTDKDIPFVIISSTLGIKLATKEEAITFANNQFYEGIKKIQMARKLDAKLGFDRQLDITGYLYEIGGVRWKK